MKISHYNEMIIQADLIKGNVNRMIVTNDLDELENMSNYAISRILAIHNYRKASLNIENFKAGLKEDDLL